jgi:hypothetical protein
MTPQPDTAPFSMRRRDLARQSGRAERSQWATVERPARVTRVSLWLPTTAIFALLAPFALALLPFLYLAPRRILPDPAAALVGVGRLLLSLSGTHVEVDTPDARVRLRFF